MFKPITIFEAIKRYNWPVPGTPVKSVEIMLGDKCNARCVFCCSSGGLGGWVSLEKTKKIIRESAQKGVWLISFSGGEAFLHPEIGEMLEYAKDNGIKMIQVVSNGIKLSDFSFAEKMAACGLNEVKISLHSVNPQKHDKIVGVKGAFFKGVKAIENLSKLGVKVSCNFAVMRQNYMELPLFAKFMREKGLTGYCFMFSFYSGKMSVSGDCSVSYSLVIPYLFYALRYIKTGRTPIETRMLNNFPPCVLPGYESIIADWRDFKENSSVSIRNKIRKGREIYAGRKVLLKACRQCVYGKVCYGVDRGYLRFFGDREFIPLVKKTESEIGTPLYL